MILRIDDLGRVLVPKPVRVALGLDPGGHLEAEMNELDQSLTIHKPRACCTFCGATTDLASLRGRYICHVCVQELKLKDKPLRKPVQSTR